MCNIGLHYRVCHSRLFVRQARVLQDSGLTVVRCDTSRVGYSQGDLPGGRALDVFDEVQTGLFMDDTLQLVDYCKNNFKPKFIFLYGLCGGALTAVLTAAKDKSINGVIFIAGPVNLSSEEELTTMHPFEADVFMKGYILKALNIKSWARFVSGKTSYKDLFNAIKVKAANKMSRPKVDTNQHIEKRETGQSKGEVFNTIFYQAFEKSVKMGQKTFFILPELDRATYDFDKYFMPILKEHSEYQDGYSICRIDKADHTFSRPDSSQSLIEAARDWLLSKSNA